MSDRERRSAKPPGPAPGPPEARERGNPAADPRRTLTGVLALRRELEGQLGAERQRAATAEARCREAEAAAALVFESFEERRILAAELRTMLDATEYHITTLEAEVRVRESELRALGEIHLAELDGLRNEHESAAEGAAELRGRLEETAAILEEAFAESAGLRGLAEDLRQAAEAERASGAVARAERDELRRELGAAHGETHTQRADLEQRDRELAHAAAEMRSARENTARLEGQIVDLQRQSARAAEERDRLAGIAAQLERDLGEADGRGCAAEQSLAQATIELGVRGAALAEVGAERDCLLENSDRLVEERDALANGLAGARGEIEEARREIENRRRAGDEAAARLAALEQRIRSVEEERGRAEEAANRLRQALANQAAESETARLELETALRECGLERERGDRAEAERAEVAERVVALTGGLESAREALLAGAAEREAIVSGLCGERDELERRCAASVREYAELAELLGVAGRELEETRQSASARLAEREEALVELRAVAERSDEEARALRAALDRAQIDGERARDARAELSGEREGLQREVLLWREQAEVARVEVSTLVAQLAEVAAGPSRPELELRVGELEQAVQLGRLKESALQTAVNDMQEQLLREQAHAASLWSDLESQAHFREALDSALAEARSRCSDLESVLHREQRRHAEAGAADRDTAQVLARAAELEARLAEADAERTAMSEQAVSMRAVVDGLERECELLRRRSVAPEGRERPRGEVGRLQARIEELERQHRDAMQRHTTAVNGYMLELNQRTETLRQRDVEIHHLSEEIGVLQATCDDAVSQLAEVRNERELLHLRARESDPARAVAPRPERGEPAGAPSQARQAAPEPRREREELRLAEPKSPGEEKKRHSAVPPARRVAAAATNEPVAVIHVEDDAGCQETVRAAVTRFPLAQYVTPAQLQEKSPSGRRVLAVNMLSRTIDPVATITQCGKLGIDDPCAFTYFAYSGRGFVLGMVDFFPHPFETDACASRLLGRPGGLQRLLAVSEDVDLMSGIREVLGRVRCSAATAFDARQALDLVPMIKPEVVLVDLGLPRGEALRIVSRLRTDPKTASISIAMLWTAPITSKDIAQSAMRVVRDFSVTNEEIGHSLERVLIDEEMGLIPSDSIRQVG